MVFNNIDFPNTLVDSIKSGNLVVFAGAGASMGSPTSLPNFEKLAEEIAEGTGNTIRNGISCEVFLGKLKAGGVPVNEQAATILSGACLEHNKLHEAIINLFPSREDIRIVTTNYDQMFEQVLETNQQIVPIYDAPALPLGDDVQGVVHLHGNVNNPKYMIVTDEDFGKAYLTEGYASRFLVKLFETYTILFIGYSYNDIILRYLSRAMCRRGVEKKYILTDDKNADWSSLDISPIWFPKRSYAVMRDGLGKLGVTVKRGLIDWKNHLTEISDAPPVDATIDAEIDYCLENIERSQVLANIIHGKEWIPFLDNKEVFECCFSEAFNDICKTNIWGNWLCDNFLGNEDESILRLVYKHSNSINTAFADKLARKLIDKPEVNDSFFSEYIVLVESVLKNSWVIAKLAEEAYKRNLILLSFCLYKQLFNYKMVVKKDYFISEYRHIFLGDNHTIRYLWDKIKAKMCAELAYEVVSFVDGKIIDLHNQYVFVDQASHEEEPWKMKMMGIEEEDQDYRMDPLRILVNMYDEAALYTQQQNAEGLKAILKREIYCDSPLMVKIGLKELRRTNVFSVKDKFDILEEHILLNKWYAREQVFKLAADIFSKISNKEKDCLINSIDSLDKEDNEIRNHAYTIYNWYVWLYRFDPKNERLRTSIERYEKDFGFKPRKQPELIIESSSEVYIPDQSPLTENELRNLSRKDAVKFLKDYNDRSFGGPSRYGLLLTFSACIAKDYKWTIGIIRELLDKKVKNDDVWESLFNGLETYNSKEKEFVELLKLLASHDSVDIYDTRLAKFFYDTVNQEKSKNYFYEHGEFLLSIADNIWKNRSIAKNDFTRTIDTTLNTTVGALLLSWISMLLYIDDKGIPEQIKDRFEEALNVRSWEKKVAACILAGHFNFLCYKDRDWAVEHLSKYLNGSEKSSFSGAWEGMTYFSRRITKDNADIIAPIIFKAIRHIEWLEDDAKHGFIELLLTLLIYVIEKPTLKYIPELYKYASENDIKKFIDSIINRLRNMDEIEKNKWWNNWLRHFLDNRKNNKPNQMSEAENQSILMLLTELDFVFDEAAQIVCKGSMPAKTDGLFWYLFNEKHFAKKYPHSAAFVVVKVLNSVSEIGFDEEYITEIVREMEGLDEKESKQIKEALLIKNITV